MSFFPIKFVRSENRGQYPAGYALNERPRDDARAKKLEEDKYSHGLLNWGIRACKYYLANKSNCPCPEMVKEVTERFKNANNPIPQYINSTNEYVFDAEGDVSFNDFLNNMRKFCRENIIQNKFTQAKEFRKLIARLGENDSENKLYLNRNHDGVEIIIGIRLVVNDLVLD